MIDVDYGGTISPDYMRGWLAAVEWLAADPEEHKRTATQLDQELAQARASRVETALRYRELDLAQARGPVAYAEARAWYGLVPEDPRGVWASWAEFAAGGAHAVGV